MRAFFLKEFLGKERRLMNFVCIVLYVQLIKADARSKKSV